MEREPLAKTTARSAAEEILRIIYGDDLEGCTVSLDRITDVISTAMAAQVQFDRAIADFEREGLRSDPPPLHSTGQRPLTERGRVALASR
jgi:hypothetical protein